MKDIRQMFIKLRGDRTLMFFVSAIVLLAAFFVIYTLTQIRPSDIQVVSHYTGLGETHFYKQQWYTLYGLPLFGLFVALANVSLMIKMFLLDRRDFSILIGWLTIVLLIIAFSYASGVLNLAFL